MGIPAKFILSTTLLLKNRLHTQTHTHTDTSKKTTGTTPKRQKPDHTCLAKVCHMDGPREQISAPTAPCGRVGREIVRRCYNSETKMKPKRSSGLSLVPVLRAPPRLAQTAAISALVFRWSAKQRLLCSHWHTAYFTSTPGIVTSMETVVDSLTLFEDPHCQLSS